MPQPIDTPAEARKLRRALHEKIDQLSAMLEWELKGLRQNIDSEFDKDRDAEKLTPAKVNEAIALHRVRRPYGR